MNISKTEPGNTTFIQENGKNSTTPQDLENIIQGNTFIVTKFIDSGSDETSYFRCYSFTFNTNGTVVATSPNNTINGTWSITEDDDDSQDDLDFNLFFNQNNQFEELNDDWDFISYTSNKIELIDISGGNGGTDYLTFEIGTPSTNCSSSATQNTIENNVQNGSWRITHFIDSGSDETDDFTGYNFTFNSTGVLNANNGTNNYNGTWSITDSNSNDDSLDDLDFNIYFDLTNNFEDLNDDWDILTQNAAKIELIDVSGGNGGTDYLSFEKN